MDYSKVIEEVQKGMQGQSQWIPLGFPKLDKYIGIGKRLYTVIGGAAGTGKTSFADQAFVLNTYKWYIENQDKTNTKLKIIYRSMERSKTFKIAKWTCFELFTRYGILMDVPTLLGWGCSKNRVPQEVYEKVVELKDYFDKILDTVKIIDGIDSPTNVFEQLQYYARQNGKIEKVGFENRYIPNNDNLITLVIIDHMGKVAKEGNTTKGAIDKMSEYLTIARDFYGFSPVVVSQFNRNSFDVDRRTKLELTPQVDDLKDSSCLAEDSDLILAIFNPYKYKVFDHMGYDIKSFIVNGANKFRSVSTLKNSYGIDDFRVGMKFEGAIGLYSELQKASENMKMPEDNIKLNLT